MHHPCPPFAACPHPGITQGSIHQVYGVRLRDFNKGAGKIAEGFKDFTSAVLTSTDVDDYLMRQTIMRFASAAARDSAISTVDVEGMFAVDKTENALTAFDGTNWMEFGRYGAWKSYTPTWTCASTNPTLGNGTLVGFYSRHGSSCAVRIMLTTGSTTNAGTGYFKFTLPFSGKASTEQVMHCKAFLAGPAITYTGTAQILTADVANVVGLLPASSSISYSAATQSADATAATGTGIPLVAGAYTYATGSNFMVEGVYEVA